MEGKRTELKNEISQHIPFHVVFAFELSESFTHLRLGPYVPLQGNGTKRPDLLSHIYEITPFSDV